MQSKDFHICQPLTATSSTIPGPKASEIFGLWGLPNVSGMIPGTTVWLFWLFRILCSLAPTPRSFSPSLYVCHLFCICIGCSLAGELPSCPCLQRLLSQMPLQRRSLSLLCVSAAIISATLCCQLLSLLLLNLSTASEALSVRRTRKAGRKCQRREDALHSS